MKRILVAARIDPDLYEALDVEVKRRKLDKAELIRTFIRDGLARYDSTSEQILHTQLAILEQLKIMQDLAGAAVHLHVEQQVLELRQEPNEPPETYTARLLATYRKKVFEAIVKGGRIVAAVPEMPASRKVSRGH
jgi:hypothetical protein